MLQLEAGHGSGIPDGLDQPDMPFQMNRRVEAELAMFRPAGGAVDAAELDDDHPGAAFGAGAVKGDLFRRDVALEAAELGRHRRHDDPVGNREPAQLQRAEQPWVTHLGHSKPPPGEHVRILVRRVASIRRMGDGLLLFAQN